MCGCGGIGRRAWFRSMYPQGCEGSSPFIRTTTGLLEGVLKPTRPIHQNGTACPLVLFAALAARAFARFASSAAFRAGDSFLLATAFFGAGAGSLAWWNAAHRFFCANAIRFLATALILRFGFAPPVVTEAAAFGGRIPNWRCMSAIFSSMFSSD